MSDYLSNLENKVKKNNEILNKIKDETYNYNYNDDIINNINGATAPPLNDMTNIITRNHEEINEEIINNLKKIDKTVIGSMDTYRNQSHFNTYINGQNVKISSKHGSLLNKYNESKKKMLINYYYYKKNKALNQILYYLVLIVISLFVLKYLNKYFKFIFYDTLYVITCGILISIYFIYLIYKLYDILARDVSNIDEYGFNNNYSIGLSTNNYEDSDLYKNATRLKDINLSDNECVKEYKNYFKDKLSEDI
jgi:hypothetical protein|tara:strand:+ start:271 stop:1023 length:753 start_codon:yes stop_codon:yes gene_type:complete